MPGPSTAMLSSASGAARIALASAPSLSSLPSAASSPAPADLASLSDSTSRRCSACVSSATGALSAIGAGPPAAPLASPVASGSASGSASMMGDSARCLRTWLCCARHAIQPSVAHIGSTSAA
eukprot:6056419-Pleurochrysis_carterae.AAC.2